MCGRVTLRTPAEAVAEAFDLDEPPPPLPARENIAPTDELAVVRLSPERGRALGLVRWGLVPPWAPDPSVGTQMFNARAETVFARPAFRDAARARRCLIVVDGFYEWKDEPIAPARRHKRAFTFRRPDGKPFALAGIWERWRPPEGGATLETATVLTVDANDEVRPVHDRMPLVLAPEDWAVWLDPKVTDPAALEPLMRPCPAGVLVAVEGGPPGSAPPPPPPAPGPRQGELSF